MNAEEERKQKMSEEVNIKWRNNCQKVTIFSMFE